ncbi:MAG: hypothetical protein ACI4GB_10025 [Acutalibacteraceae bacterium]
MKKILFYPLWKVDGLEKKLHDYELEGWRVKSVSYSYIFEFIKAKPKNTDYIVTYDMARDRTACMYEYEQRLLVEHSANIVETRFTGYDLFRITGENRDYGKLKNYRKAYFKHVLLQYMLIAFVVLVLGLLLILASVLQQDFGLRFILSCIYTFIAAIIFSYRLYGYIKQKMNCRTD